LDLQTDSDGRRPGGLLARIAAFGTIAPEGAAIVLVVATLAGLSFLAGLTGVGLAAIVAALAAGGFFRDPDRFPTGAAGKVTSGADGRVSAVTDSVAGGEAPGRGYRQVSVFMSPLNVHVNRAPVAGEVIVVRHTRGKFGAAFRDHASRHNERNLIVVRDIAGRRHAMVQVAGYLARRIVCRLRTHDRIEPGQRIGLIMFGSRVDHFIPPGYRVTVTVGQRVRAGETIIAELEQ